MTAGEMLREGIRLSKAGHKRRAAQVLSVLVEQEPENELAWMWLSDCAENEQQRRDCLSRVLEINPQNQAVRAYLAETGPLHTSAETRYMQQYDACALALEADPERAVDWLGKGFAAGMLSSTTRNRVPEFVECVTRCLACGPGRGLAIARAADGLDELLRGDILEYIRALAGWIDQLAGCSPAAMSNIYRVEQVRLADLSYLLDHADAPAARRRLISTCEEAFRHMLHTTRQTTRGPRARQEMAQTLKNFLLANLGLSGLNKDPELTARINMMIEVM